MAFFSFTKVIMSSFFKKSATAAYPFKPLPKAPIVRGSVLFEKENCILCGICANKCPAGAIMVDKAAGTWEISRFGCVLCNSCVELCPKKCLRMVPVLTPASDTLIKEKCTNIN